MPNYDAVIEFFKKNQFYNFLKNSDTILKPFKIGSTETKISPDCATVQPTANEQGQLQLGLGIGEMLVSNSHKEYNHEKTIVDTEEKLDELVNELNKNTIFSLDVETTGINPTFVCIAAVYVSLNGLRINAKVIFACVAPQRSNAAG